MKRTLMIALPLVLVLAAAAVAVAMFLARPEAETQIPEAVVPLVRVQEVVPEDLRLTVKSQGTVSPRTESTLVPEVAGRVIEVAPGFVSGGYFAAGDVLLRIDPHDYRRAVVQAEAQVAQAELRLAQEEAEAEISAREWKDLDGGEATPLTLHVPQLAQAKAAVAAAEAALEKAARDLDRTEIRALYEGRVRTKSADVGQYVTPGTPLGVIYAVDYAEIRLPLPDRDLAFIDLPFDYRGAADPRPGPKVILSAEFAGRRHEWEGRIVRTEGEIDPRTRMVHTVVRIKDPYGPGKDPNRAPLAAGLWVEAEITGRRVEGATTLPRSAVRDNDQVLIVDGDDRLRFRTVEILRRTSAEVVVTGGLEAGERVCLSPLTVVTDGMHVQVEAS